MSDDLDRQIAERLGWKATNNVCPNPEYFWTTWQDHGGRQYLYLPAFSTSLDAMAQAERELTADEQRPYAEWLVTITDGGLNPELDTSPEYRLATAPAHVRAAAFLEATKGRVKV